MYDAENRLSQVSVTKDGKTAVIQQNIYNGEGQRIQKIDGDETINYYYQMRMESKTHRIWLEPMEMSSQQKDFNRMQHNIIFTTKISRKVQAVL